MLLYIFKYFYLHPSLKMKYLFLIVFSLWNLVLPGQPQIIWNERCESAYQDILSLRFKKAEKLLMTEKSENPDNLYVPYLENYIDFLSVFISEDETLFNSRGNALYSNSLNGVWHI